NMRVDINASLDAPGILVLADSYYPGWRVYVDGKEGEILRANLFFRGVKLAPGEHRVEFRYEPRSFQIGLWISLATLVGLTLISALLFARKRKRDVSADASRTA
ncbi:MAG TPA: YfhO family protein, partial [Candidatus Binatia bacterium]|nr:YfhO family protein [Candidatus Binatia bacterium]